MARRVDVVRVHVGQSRGTGFLIDRGRVLTALHVIGTKGAQGLVLHDPSITITGAVMDPGAPGQPSTFRPVVIVCAAGDVVDSDPELDWACIQVDQDDFKGVAALGLRTLDARAQNTSWDTYGFPNGSEDDGKATAGTIASTQASLRIRSTSVEAIQVFSQEAAAGDGGVVRGFSGAPVLVEGHAVGILCAAPQDSGRSVEGTLYAIPLKAIAARLGLPDVTPLRPPPDASRVDAARMPRIDWEAKIDAIGRLAKSVNDCFERDPTAAAMSAIDLVERVADCSIDRELDKAEARESFDEKVRRLEEKGVIPRREGNAFRTAYQSMQSFVRSDTLGRRSDPREFEWGLSSLEMVVEWFFGAIKRPPPPFPRRPPSRGPRPAPDATPQSPTRTIERTGTRYGTGIGEFMAIWRTKSVASTLRFDAPDGHDPAPFKIEDPSRTYLIGRGVRRDGTPNDFQLSAAWTTIGRDAGKVSTARSDIVITNTSSTRNLYVRGEAVGPSGTRALRHGDTVQLGDHVGLFSDGRYYAITPPVAVDACTGLLSRLGIVAEIAGYLASGKARTLLVVRSTASVFDEAGNARGADPDRRVAEVAIALHQHDPSAPVAMLGKDVAILLSADARVEDCAAVAARALNGPSVAGFLALRGAADQAGPRLEACLGALGRIAMAGTKPESPADLGKYALVPTPLSAFADLALPLFANGGGAVLFALGEIDRLRQRSPQALPVLDLELLEMLGARKGPHDLVSFAGPGLIAFATPGDVERFAQETAVAWHARGPATVGSLEIDRSVSVHLLRSNDLPELPSRAQAMAQGAIDALGLSGFPSPLALAAQSIDGAPDDATRARRLIDLAEMAWKILAFALVASARAPAPAPDVKPSPAPAATSTWPAPWRAMAREAAQRVDARAGRVNDLAAVALTADRFGPLASALEQIGSAATIVAGASVDAGWWAATCPRLERAVREVVSALGPLRGWTLVSVEGAKVLDLDGTVQHIEYVDHTGPSMHGSRQRVSVIGFRQLPYFVYLARWEERLAVALEPFVRRTRIDGEREDEIVVAVAPITATGQHRYRSVATGRELELTVTASQLGKRS